MNETIEIIKVITNINDDLFDIVGPEYPRLSYSTDGYCNIIEYIGNRIWSSEDDERAFDELENEYEPLEPFIRNLINTIHKEIGAIQI